MNDEQKKKIQAAITKLKPKDPRVVAIRAMIALAKAKGTKGDAGDKGESGADGKDGASVKGDAGADGKDGVGIRGERGIDGAKGIDGTKGINGLDGEYGLRWMGEYSSGASYIAGDVVGYNGSAFVCTAPTSLAPPSGNWDLLASIGAAGAGYRGETGAAGVAGATGSTGTTGATGSTGATGATGARGATPAIGGATTQVQFNLEGVFAGDAGFTYDATTGFINGMNFSSRSGSKNTCVGAYAGKLIATGTNDNVAIGYEALQAKTTSGNGNVAVGASAMWRATTASQCTAIGFQSQFGNAAGTGISNASFGYNSMGSVIGGGYNSAFGSSALYGLTSGSQNVACGLNGLYSITITSNNTSIGAAALEYVTNGAGNVGIGWGAGRYKTASGTTSHTLSGDYNVYIGYQARASGDSVTKEVVIGSFDALGLGSNTTVIGTSTTLGNRIFGVASTGQVAPTVASAATIAPTTAIVFVSGITSISTITPPSTIATTGGQITIIPTGVFLTTVTGNIALASTSVVGKALIMTYDAGTTKWYPSY